jgi:dephospho-CoA kinase
VTRERPDVAAVGLTGGIGAGKSTALRYFGEAGALTLSADEVVHQLYGREEVKRALAEHFGAELLAVDGEVDRKSLAEAVRGKHEQLGWLESLTHPLVAGEIKRFIQEAPAGSVVVCEVPLLFEAGMNDLFDIIITIEARADFRRQRSVHAFDEELFTELETLQASTWRRVDGAHLAYHNDGTLPPLRRFVDVVYDRARALLESPKPAEESRG